MQKLLEGASRPDCALAAAITIDEAGEVNYPYESKTKRECTGVVEADGHLSFLAAAADACVSEKGGFR